MRSKSLSRLSVPVPGEYPRKEVHTHQPLVFAAAPRGGVPAEVFLIASGESQRVLAVAEKTEM